ncbi:acetylornithine transaminase [Yimella sp. cx-573]|nr:acetylornithine transaminase [Yimella sp. cx-573]
MNQAEALASYAHDVLPVFGMPALVLDRGEGCYVWDLDGKRYLDLLGGIAVNAVGHNHPDLVAAVSKQAGEMVHISNFFTSRPQIELARQLLQISVAPDGSKVFFANSGTEANEAAIKLSRRTGRSRIIAAEGAFHGRSTGALALTHKPAYREPFEPLLPGVQHVPYGDIEALRAVVDEQTAAVFLEPIQGEAGVVEGSREYLRAAREITAEHGALLVFDEVQTGIGRTGSWLAHQHAGVLPDAVTLAKGLGGGVPIGALITMGAQTSGLLAAGQHGTTFGGNPLACAAGLAVLDIIERQALLQHAEEVGEWFRQAVRAADIPGVEDVRGRGLLQGVVLTDEIAASVATSARAAGFIVNAATVTVLRLAPPLIISREELQTFIDALPALIQEVSP